MPRNFPEDAEAQIIDLLKAHGAMSAAQIGQHFLTPSGQNSNPGTLGACAILRRMKAKQLVCSYPSIGKTWYRTLWTLERP